MKYLIYFIALIVLAGLQVGLFSYLKFFGAVPNLFLLFLVGCCLQREADDAFFVALLAGLFADLMNGLFIGSYTLSFLILALLLYLVIHQLVVFELSFKYLLTVTLIAVLFTGVLSWLVSLLSIHIGWAPVAVDFHVWWSRLPQELAYNLALSYPLYFLATWIHNSILKIQGQKYRIL